MSLERRVRIAPRSGSIHNESGGARNIIVHPHKSPEACFQCHLDKQGQFNLPHYHPVLEGNNCHTGAFPKE